MSLTVSVSTDRLHIVGDSITAFSFHSQAGGLIDQINRANPTTQGLALSAASPGTLSVSSGQTAGRVLPACPNKLAVTSSGVSGNRIQDINIATRVTAFNPTKLIFEVAVNDANLGTDPNTFLTTFQTAINSAVAGTPALASNGIAVMAALEIGELFNAGPGNAWGLNAKDSAVDAINAKLVILAANNPGVVTFLDTRTALGLWLQAHGGTSPGVASGVITFDQFHPMELGCVLMGTFSMAGGIVVTS